MTQSHLNIQIIRMDKDFLNACPTICYDFYDTYFGKILLANTQNGICFLSFLDDETLATKDLQHTFPNAEFLQQSSKFQSDVISFLNKEIKDAYLIPLHIQGSDFQIHVWNTLLEIPVGKTATYAEIAQKINNPKACRAVGSAIGKNQVALLIPCHRVLQTSGKLGGYKWSTERKKKILEYELKPLD